MTTKNKHGARRSQGYYFVYLLSSLSGTLLAADREQQLKKWRREKKITLFATSNPQWRDLTPEIPLMIGFPRPLKLGLGITQKA